MKIDDIHSMETWYSEDNEITKVNLTIDFIGDDPSYDKLLDIFKKKRSFYIFTDKELDEIYKNKVEKPDDYEKIDYLVEKLSELLGTKARKKDKN
jgi:hypothetical protein